MGSKAVDLGQHYYLDIRLGTMLRGDWRVHYAATDSFSCTCYYRHSSANPPTSTSTYTLGYNTELTDSNGISYYINNETGKVSYYQTNSDNVEITSNIFNNRTKLSMSELTEQYKVGDDWVNNLRNYNPGDEVVFCDTIAEIYYDQDGDFTAFEFKDDTFGENGAFAFRGDLTSEYQVGDELTLNFLVVAYDCVGDIVFEELNYQQEYYDNKVIPDINNYILT